MLVHFFTLILLLGWLVPPPTLAQAPVPRWTTANLAMQHTGRSVPYPRATVMDEAGNVFTAGMFYDTISFGPHRLYSAGSNDFYVAKYVPATHTWAWAVRGGGLQSDHAYGLAVHNGCVYVTGYLQNNYLDDNGVTLDSTEPVAQPGAVNAEPSSDMFLAKYFDCGSHAILGWCQVAGGASMDYATSVAVSGRSVYITGTSENNTSHAQGVVFGTTGPLPGLYPQLGTSRTLGTSLVLAKYTDHGFSASFNWSQVAGSKGGGGVGRGVAVRGRCVYLAGDIASRDSDSARIYLGGHGRVLGTPRLYGLSGQIGQGWLLIKYLDLGDHAAYGWSQVAIAVSGHSVYVSGSIYNDRSDSMHVRFGCSGPAAGTYPAPGLDRRVGLATVLAKYTDHGPTGAFEWLRTDGRSDFYEGTSLVAQGSWVYLLARSFFNRTHTRQGIRGGIRLKRGERRRGDPPYEVQDIPYVAGYYDEGSHATLRWVRISDYRSWLMHHQRFLALQGTHLYVIGNTILPARFGRLTLTAPGPDFGFAIAGLDLSPALNAVAERRAR
jgi:hypothetical protein